MKSLFSKKICNVHLKCIDKRVCQSFDHFPHFQPKRHFSLLTNTNYESENDEFVKGLSSEEKDFLNENGYLCIKNFVSSQIALNLRNRMMQLLSDFDENSTSSVFSSHRTEKQYKDTYFLNSGNKICYFWEENVFDENGKLNRDKQLAINKVGHALHKLDPYFESFIYGYLPKLTKDVGFKRPIALQSMYICKQPGVGGEVSKHQDTTFLMTNPHSCHGFWLAVDKTDASNGCVVVAPGSHKTAKLRNRFKRVGDDQTSMIPLVDDGSFDDFKIEDGVPIECESGDLLILHGEVVHWSDANTSDAPRHALMMHIVDGACDYPSDNWLQYPPGESFAEFTENDVENQPQRGQLIANASF